MLKKGRRMQKNTFEIFSGIGILFMASSDRKLF